MWPKNKYYYRAYGLIVTSCLPIAGFEAVPLQQPDVFINEDIVPEKLQDALNCSQNIQSNENEFIIHLDMVGAFLIKNGNSITFQRTGKVTNSDISSCITGICMGAILLQRKYLPLHASTVVFHNKCFVFAGMSGSGKTTMATALLKAGGILVADDISLIDFSYTIPRVKPAFPAVKIWADSLSQLSISWEGLTPVRKELNKYFYPVERFAQEPIGIDHIFILYKSQNPDIVIDEISGAEKFRLLMKYTYLFRGIPKTGLEINHFHLVSRLAESISLSKLSRPNQPFNSKKFMEFLKRNI